MFLIGRTVVIGSLGPNRAWIDITKALRVYFCEIYWAASVGVEGRKLQNRGIFKKETEVRKEKNMSNVNSNNSIGNSEKFVYGSDNFRESKQKGKLQVFEINK